MLFGPLLSYEVLRSARHRRHVLFRFVYAVGLFLLLWSVLADSDPVRLGTRESATQLSRVAEAFFYTLMWVQLLAVVLLTPAYTAGAIAEEKARKTLEFLLISDLGDREIVLSKLAVRLGHIVLLLLTGLP